LDPQSYCAFDEEARPVKLLRHGAHVIHGEANGRINNVISNLFDLAKNAEGAGIDNIDAALHRPPSPNTRGATTAAIARLIAQRRVKDAT
jgi:hypothetical protein